VSVEAPAAGADAGSEEAAEAERMPMDLEFGLRDGERPQMEDVRGRAILHIGDGLAVLAEKDARAAVAEGVDLEGELADEGVLEAATAEAESREAAWGAFQEALAAEDAAAGVQGAGNAGGKGKGKAKGKDKKSKGKAKAKPKAKPKGKDKGKSKKGDPAPEDEGPPPHPYAASGAKFTIELETVGRSLVESPPQPAPALLKASDLVPTRPGPPSGPPAPDAAANFRQEVALCAHAVAEAYAAHAASGGETRDGTNTAAEREV